MYTLTTIIKNEDTGENREDKREFDTKQELENFTANEEKVTTMTYDLYIRAEKDNVIEPLEDDGDHYNGDVDSDINA